MSASAHHAAGALFSGNTKGLLPDDPGLRATLLDTDFEQKSEAAARDGDGVCASVPMPKRLERAASPRRANAPILLVVDGAASLESPSLQRSCRSSSDPP